MSLKERSVMNLKSVWNNLVKELSKTFEPSTQMIFIKEIDGNKLYARKGNEANQQLSNNIYEFAHYSDRKEEWACLMPNCNRVYFEVKTPKGKRIGFSESVLMKGNFLDSVHNHLPNLKLEKRKWWSNEL